MASPTEPAFEWLEATTDRVTSWDMLVVQSQAISLLDHGDLVAAIAPVAELVSLFAAQCTETGFDSYVLMWWKAALGPPQYRPYCFGCKSNLTSNSLMVRRGFVQGQDPLTSLRDPS